MEEYARQLHAPYRRPKVYRQIIAMGVDEIWGGDTMSMQWSDQGDFAGHNDGFKFISVWVDVFSRFLFARPLKTTQAVETLAAFKDIIDKSNREPQKIWFDRGGELKGPFAKWAKGAKIPIYHSNGQHKVALAERMNRTIAHEIWLYFDEKQTRKWIDVLPEIVDRINNRLQRAIGMTPAEASALDEAGQAELWTHQYGEVQPNIAPKLAVGDWVRLARTKTAFEKGSTQNWTGEPFEIVDLRLGHPPQYRLRDLLGEDIEGWVYEAELQFLSKDRPTEFLVREIVRERMRAGKREFLVKWVGLDDRFNSWQDADTVTKVFNPPKK